MTRKIPVLVDEDVYYHLQQLCVAPTRDLGEVVRALLLGAETRADGAPVAMERTLRKRDLLAELQDGCGLTAGNRQSRHG